MPDRPLRILGVGDGRSLIFLRWAWRVAERGHEVHFVSDRITERPSELEGITAHDLTKLSLGTRVKGVRRFVFARRDPQPREAARRRPRPRALPAAVRLLGRAGRRAPARHEPVEHGHLHVRARQSARPQRWVREAVAAGDRYVVSSIGNAEETVRLGAPRTRSIASSGTSTFARSGRTSASRASPGASAGRTTRSSSSRFGTTGRTRTWTSLIRAFARARKEVPQARLILAARGGWTREETERLVDELGLRDAVAFHFAAPEELPELCASAEIGVSIASTDATPASMIESMASRLPMIMGDAITIDEWITQGEGGEVVQPRDEDAVYEALVKLSARPRAQTALRRAERARRPRAALRAPGGDARARVRQGPGALRVLCLGLDGADFDLVQELRGQGKLPTIDRLAGRGTFGPLRSTIPAATPTAWSSFLTGLNPGGHGIFNFSTNPNRSLERVESAASRGGAPFWRALGAAGHRSAFVTVPFTFPPEPLDGVARLRLRRARSSRRSSPPRRASGSSSAIRISSPRTIR